MCICCFHYTIHKQIKIYPQNLEMLIPIFTNNDSKFNEN